MRNKKLIQLYITNMCNSHCKTCSIWKNENCEELSSDSIKKVIKAFPDADYVVGGGEAILNNHIDKILYLLKDMEVNYTLLSNCIWVGRLRNLIEKYDVPAVTVSFDGTCHDDIRGFAGNMVKIIDFKEWCDVNNVHMKVSYTYSKYNELFFDADMKFIKNRLGFGEIYFCIAQDMDLLKTSESGENFVAKDFEQILRCDMISEKDKRHVKSMLSGVRRCCTSQSNVHTIYSNGDIVRCQSFKSEEVLGNIYDMSVMDIRRVLNSVENEICKFDAECDLLCQRRYD